MFHEVSGGFIWPLTWSEPSPWELSGGGILLLEQVEQSFGFLLNAALLSDFVERLVLLLDIMLILVVDMNVGTLDVSQTYSE
jgi:hypothetical protein